MWIFHVNCFSLLYNILLYDIFHFVLFSRENPLRLTCAPSIFAPNMLCLALCLPFPGTSGKCLACFFVPSMLF